MFDEFEVDVAFKHPLTGSEDYLGITPETSTLLITPLSVKQINSIPDDAPTAYCDGILKDMIQKAIEADPQLMMFKTFLCEIAQKYGLVIGQNGDEQILIGGTSIAIALAKTEIERLYHTDELTYKFWKTLCHQPQSTEAPPSVPSNGLN